jgi:hypothetical protein
MEENYTERSLSVGAFGYHGKWPTAAFGNVEDRVTRVGAKFDAYIDELNLFGAIVTGKDRIQETPERTIDTSAFFVQADYMMLPWVMPVVRFEKTNFSDGRRAIRQIVPAVNVAVRANVKVLVEGRLFGDEGGRDEGIVRLDFLF